MKVSQKCSWPRVSFIMRPVILPNQKYVPAKTPKMDATPITMWKWPTTKYVACNTMSMEGCARKKPLTPPLTNMEMNPSAKSDAELIRMFAPLRLPSQIRVMIVAGIVMVSVGNEKSSDENGFMPLTNMWCPHTIQLKKPMDIIE